MPEFDTNTHVHTHPCEDTMPLIGSLSLALFVQALSNQSSDHNRNQTTNNAQKKAMLTYTVGVFKV